MDRWLGFWAFAAMAQVQSLVGEVRFPQPVRSFVQGGQKQTEKIKKKSFKTFKTQINNPLCGIGGRIK